MRHHLLVKLSWRRFQPEMHVCTMEEAMMGHERGFVAVCFSNSDLPILAVRIPCEKYRCNIKQFDQFVPVQYLVWVLDLPAVNF